MPRRAQVHQAPGHGDLAEPGADRGLGPIGLQALEEGDHGVLEQVFRLGTMAYQAADQAEGGRGQGVVELAARALVPLAGFGHSFGRGSNFDQSGHGSLDARGPKRSQEFSAGW